MLDQLHQFVIDTVAGYGYAAVFVLMVLESACVPIPSEVTMLFGGALAAPGFAAPGEELSLLWVGIAGTLGNLVGSWIAYWVGAVGGRPLVDRFGRYLLIRPHEVDKAHDWFERYGEQAVFFGRLLPVIRTFISLPAGVVRMPFWRFSAYTLLGSLPWCIALTWIGALLGTRWETAERVFRPFAWAIAGVVGVAIVVFVWRRLRQIRAEEAERVTADRRDEPG